MRILIQAFTSASGGSSSVLNTLLKYWPVGDDLLALAWRPEMIRRLQDSGIDVLPIPARSTAHALALAASTHRSTLRRWKPDVIYSQQYYLPGIDVPQAIHHRNLLRFDPGVSRSIKVWLRDRLSEAALRRADVNIFNSQALYAAATQRFPNINLSRSVVIHNAIDTAVFEGPSLRSDQQKPRILVPQGDMPHKRNDVAVQILQRSITRMKSSVEQLEMIFAGSGSYKSTKRRAQELGLEAQVHFTGYLERHKLAEYYRSSAAVLITSLKESFCNPIIEAHAAAVPIVTPPLPVAVEIAGPLSRIASDSSVTALADALVDVLRNRPEWSQQANASTFHAKRFRPTTKALEVRAALVAAMDARQ